MYTYVSIIKLVGGLVSMNFLTFHSVGNGMSLSQLTNSIIFQRARLKPQPPTSYGLPSPKWIQEPRPKNCRWQSELSSGAKLSSFFSACLPPLRQASRQIFDQASGTKLWVNLNFCFADGNCRRNSSKEPEFWIFQGIKQTGRYCGMYHL